MSLPADKPAPLQLTLGPATTDLVRTLKKGCTSFHTARSYGKAFDDLDAFAGGRPLSLSLLLDWRQAMQRGANIGLDTSGADAATVRPLSPATINLRLTAARALIRAARRARLVSAEGAAELLDVRNLPQRGVRTGNWLTTDQCRRLLEVPRRNTLRGKRNYCVLALLLGCALRRDELAGLTVDHLQMRDERWIIENLRGKGGRVRSIAVPPWVKDAVAAWMWAAEIRDGRIVRQLAAGSTSLSADSIWEIVSKAAAAIGVQDFSPHDLRRTCAKLCRKNGGELEQIQFMLGHASLVTTERYLGSVQNLKAAVNDSLSFA